ncbi:MAG: hypothetical protein ACC657_16905, partial [Thiohalomonadales bacterium]
NLPGYTVISSQKKRNGMYLIIGMGENGESVIWLSNAKSATNKTGRVLYVVGKAKAYSKPWVAPDGY